MNSKQPKKNIRSIKFKDKLTGDSQRIENLRTIMHKATDFPKPLQYEDIDSAFYDFVVNEMKLTDENGNEIPTFTLYSNQRFSEYSQTWNYTDENGNLLLNFKTINRENNPKKGENQSNYWNIPGNRYYTLFQKTAMSDNGEEYVEVYSMKQPMSIDLSFRVNFVTNTIEQINRFNERLNDLFKARQCYIRPNGHFVPMILEDANDESSYSIEDRKIFVQSVNIRVLGYIIKPEDYKISKYPKYPKLYDAYQKLKKHKKPTVNIEETQLMESKAIDVEIEFPSNISKVEFVIDTDIDIQEVLTDNIRQFRLSVNNNPTFFEKGFSLKNNDEIKIRIFRLNEVKKASIVFKGVSPSEVYNVNDINNEDVSTIPTTEIITVDFEN